MITTGNNDLGQPLDIKCTLLLATNLGLDWDCWDRGSRTWNLAWQFFAPTGAQEMQIFVC